jgi:4-hydroxy-tetrahydrodipicolinate synthase
MKSKISQYTFSGTWPAIVTPFTADAAAVDYQSLGSLLEFQHANGVEGIVVCGSTGEAATLEPEEYREVIAWVVQWCRGKLPVVAGIGASSTARAVASAQELNAAGLDGLLVVTPPYNKPPQAGLIEHFRAVKRATALPMIAYNVPGRTGINMQPATVGVLAREGTIAALKDASGSIEQLLETLRECEGRLSVLAGEDSLVYPTMSCGGSGTISASANVAPKEFVGITGRYLAGDTAGAAQQQLELLPLVRALFMETNPIPVKTALALKGVIASAAVRLPLVAASEATQARLAELLK